MQKKRASETFSFASQIKKNKRYNISEIRNSITTHENILNIYNNSSENQTKIQF